MSATQITQGKEAFNKIESGVNKLADIVKSTLGPAGKTVLMSTGFGNKATKDGVTVALMVQLVDPVEDIAAQTVKQVANKSNEDVGDGTTTATVLAQALLNHGFKRINNKDISNVNTYKRGITKAFEEVVTELRIASTKVEGKEELRKVALISANGEHMVADLIMEAFEIIGDTGAIKLDLGRKPECYVENVSGMTYGNGMVSPYLASDQTKMQWNKQDVLVLATDFPIKHLEEIRPALDYAHKLSRPLLILCDEMDDEALRFVIMNQRSGNLDCCVVKAPGFGSQKQARCLDIMQFTGGKALLKDTIPSLRLLSEQDDDVPEEYKPENYLGRAESINVKRNEFTIVGGKCDEQELKEYNDVLLEQISIEEDPYMKDKMSERLAKLTRGVAQIYVGAESELEAKELKDRVEDALNAVKAAEKEGYIPGGGLTLKRIAFVKDKNNESSDYEKGYTDMLRAIEEPFKQILVNAELWDDQQNYDTFTDGFNRGIDIMGEEHVSIDYLENGIIDPVSVTISALTNAVSICSTLLTVSGTIHFVPETYKSTPI